MLKVTVILAALAACYASPLPAEPTVLECRAGTVSFELIERQETIWINGNGLVINRELSDAHYLVAAITGARVSTSIVLADDGHFTQTFLPNDGSAPVFLEGECNPTARPEPE